MSRKAKCTVIIYNGKMYHGIESFEGMDQAFAFCKNICTTPIGLDRFEITHIDAPLKAAIGIRTARGEITWSVEG